MESDSDCSFDFTEDDILTPEIHVPETGPEIHVPQRKSQELLNFIQVKNHIFG